MSTFLVQPSLDQADAEVSQKTQLKTNRDEIRKTGNRKISIVLPSGSAVFKVINYHPVNSYYSLVEQLKPGPL